MKRASAAEVSTLIAGASGQVGHHLARAAERRGLSWAGTYHATPLPGLLSLDVRDAQAVARVVRSSAPRYLLVPASATNVDRCEQEPRAAYEVNVLGVDHLVEAANEVGAVLVYFSSDYIFDGEAGPYDEAAVANPISRYGLQKLIAEHAVMQRARESLIVRTTVVYGWEPQGKNFIYRLLNAVREDRELVVPSDQIGSPTYAPSLADAVFDLLAQDARGVFNLAGRELAGRDELAREAMRLFGGDPAMVKSIPTAQLGQLAPRPLQAGLRVAVAERRLGRELLGYTDGLRQMLAEQSESREADGLER